MVSHPHPVGFNIEACRACGGNPLAHTVTGVGKRCSGKKQLPSGAVLWLPQNRRAHVKREGRVYSRIILASTVFAPLLYAMTGFRSSSLISGLSMISLDVLHMMVTSASMSAGAEPL